MIKPNFSEIVKAKEAAGRTAANLIQNGMIVGLGTGSTSAFFIEALGQLCREGLQISAVASSQQSMFLARSAGIPLIEHDKIVTLDITVDGADEIDSSYNMIKGGGGALLREKIFAQSSIEFIVIVDESKVVQRLGTFPIPIEICPFAYRTTIYRIEELGYRGKMRCTSDDQFYVSDNGNYIFDIQFTAPIMNPREENELLRNVAGVLETGLFFDVATQVIVGYRNGSVVKNVVGSA